jgi:hypothetical protein
MNEYHDQATSFLKATNTTMDIKFLRHAKYFPDDKDERDIYEVTIRRGARAYTFEFGQSIANSLVSAKRLDTTLHKIGDKFVTIGTDFTGPTRLAEERVRAANAHKLTPHPYHILACLQKYDPGSFDDWCAEMGLSNDSISARKTYKAVREEWRNLQALFSDEEMERLQEIQ